jgi:hypothetical protein
MIIINLSESDIFGQGLLATVAFRFGFVRYNLASPKPVQVCLQTQL